MNKTLLTFGLTALVATASAFAEEEKAELTESSAPILWGFGNYGFYSGYQLYGSLVNPDPTLQGYFEANANLPWSAGAMDNFGYLGAGVWSNSDLTRRRSDLRGAFNEWDFNIHWGKTFWLDDDRSWGIDYRTSVVWYYYPPRGGNHPNTKTTFDWNHSFAILNPYVVPFLDVVHEYTGHGTILQFGLKRDFQVFDSFSLTPSVTFVGRNNRYNWCFPTGFGAHPAAAGIASARVQLDATYMFTQNFGLFAKVAYCSIISSDMRDNIDRYDYRTYGTEKDFAWGGFGLTFAF